MKKPVPTFAPIIRADNSHLIHIGDRDNSNEKLIWAEQATKCGRMLQDIDICVFRFACKFEPDMFLGEEWKKHVPFNSRRGHKEPRLCPRCGTPEDFRDATLERLAYHEKCNAYLEYWKNRSDEVYNQLEHLHNQDFKKLFHALSDNDRFAVTLNEVDRRSRLTVTINGREYNLTPMEGIREQTSELVKAEKEAADNE